MMQVKAQQNQSLAYQFSEMKTRFRKALISEYPAASFALKCAFADYLKHLHETGATL